MARLFATFAFVVLAAVATAQSIEPLNAVVEIVEDINEYARNYDLEVTPLVGEAMPFGRIRYTMGRRVNGDRIVAQGNNNINYPTVQDVSLNLNYPQNGIGAVVTYVEINVDQASNDGNAYIVSGGIGQRQIRVVIEARHTTRFSYNAVIFGL